MQQYHDIVANVLKNGEFKKDRTGVGTLSLFGTQARYNLEYEFPLLTTKSVHFKSVVHELLWFLSGSTNTKYLNDNGVRIWNEWQDDKGNLGPVYGKQWRDWEDKDGRHIDQISNLIYNLKKDPFSRRHIVSAWNVGELDKMALPPCHSFFQFHVDNDGYLSCQLYQRSADLFLGVPFNIASYALLTYMIAQVTNLRPKEFIHTTGDTHIYANHIIQVNEMLSRNHKTLPTLKLNSNINDIFDFRYEDIILEGYDPHPAIKAPVAI